MTVVMDETISGDDDEEIGDERLPAKGSSKPDIYKITDSRSSE